MLARVPFIAAGWVLAAWLGQQLSPLVPVVLLCGGMILAAVIDGIKFKVPNWLTLSMILAGWGLGALNSLGITVGPGPIDPAAAIALPGQRRPVGGGARLARGVRPAVPGVRPRRPWARATSRCRPGSAPGSAPCTARTRGLWTILYAICAGYIVGGILGLLMIVLRGQLHRNLSNFREIATDFRLLLTVGPKAAAQRAQQRRPTWHRLPYGIPLCIGFVGYLVYLHWFYAA